MHIVVVVVTSGRQDSTSPAAVNPVFETTCTTACTISADQSTIARGSTGLGRVEFLRGGAVCRVETVVPRLPAELGT